MVPASTRSVTDDHVSFPAERELLRCPGPLVGDRPTGQAPVLNVDWFTFFDVVVRVEFRGLQRRRRRDRSVLDDPGRQTAPRTRSMNVSSASGALAAPTARTASQPVRVVRGTERQTAAKQIATLERAKQTAMIVQNRRVRQPGGTEGRPHDRTAPPASLGPPVTIVRSVLGTKRASATCTTRKPTMIAIPMK